MTSYRLLLLDDKGHLLGSTAIECTSDREAIDVAERKNGPHALIEIWRGGDPVCVCARNQHFENRDYVSDSPNRIHGGDRL